MRTSLRILLPVLCALLVSGCAGGQDDAVVAAATSFGDAVREQDGAAACAALAPLTRQQVEADEQQPCPQALLGQDLLAPAELRSLERFGRQAAVVVEDAGGRTDTWFLSRFDGRWLLVAAGCRDRGEQLPYDCDVEGG